MINAKFALLAPRYHVAALTPPDIWVNPYENLGIFLYFPDSLQGAFLIKI